MNQFFNGKRFQLLVLQHWADNRKKYLLSVFSYIGIMLLWLLATLIVEEGRWLDEDTQLASYYISLFALGTTYASQYFNHFTSKAKGSNFLLVPASHFEKLLCSLVYSVFFFFIVLSAAFYLVDFPLATFVNREVMEATPMRKAGVANVFAVPILQFKHTSIGSLLMFYFSVQSVFLFGSVLFNKFSFLKTIISCLVGGLSFICLFYVIVTAADLPDSVVFSETWMGRAMSTLTFVIPPVFWIATYFRLKVKQV